MDPVPFIKMHGLGNDFVIVDRRARPDAAFDAAAAAAVGDRRMGVGFDQLLLIEPSETGLADAFMRILNSDGSEAGACGNGTRCVAALLMDEAGEDHVVIETLAGLLDVDRTKDGRYTVDMGPVKTEWQDIPLADATDTLHLPISEGPLSDPAAVNVGNPHMVFFVDDAAKVNLPKLGKTLERHPLYPERANVQIVEVVDEGHIRQRTFERGAGITHASGSGACAGAVASHRRGHTGRKVDVELVGGTLTIEWAQDNHVLMTGPVATSFAGTLDPSLLNGAGS